MPRWEQRQHYASSLGRFCQSCERGGGLGFGVWVWGLGFGFRVWGLGFGVKGLGLWVSSV